MTPNSHIVASAWLHYKRNHRGRTAAKPHRGTNWARTLLALEVPESSLLEGDTDRGLTPITLPELEAAVLRWDGWRPFRNEVKRLADAAEKSQNEVSGNPAPGPAGESPASIRPAGPTRAELDAELERSEAANKRIEEIIAESRADAKMWLLVEYRGDAVDRVPHYWVLWYDPQYDGKGMPRGKVWNWKEDRWDPLYQTPWELYPEQVYNGSVKLMFSDKYEERRSFTVEGAMLLEEWENLMKASPEGKKYQAAQDPNNMPAANMAAAWTWGVSGHGKLKQQYVDEFGYIWERKHNYEAGEPPQGHLTDSAWPPLRDRLRALFPKKEDENAGTNA